MFQFGDNKTPAFFDPCPSSAPKNSMNAYRDGSLDRFVHPETLKWRKENRIKAYMKRLEGRVRKEMLTRMVSNVDNLERNLIDGHAVRVTVHVDMTIVEKQPATV